jgi:signal peptidase I
MRHDKALAADQRQRKGSRDIVELGVLNLILALVLRAFQAQTFALPTGSMAPTLLGRHKEIGCPQCGFTFAVNASEEVRSSRGEIVVSGSCPNCRHLARLDESPSFPGDRLLVMTFPFDLPFLPGSQLPQRWDVVVHRYPEEPEVSYIKRLVGLPGETIRVAHGDIYVKNKGSDRFVIARKPLRHQSAMQIPVYDDRYQARAFAGISQWRRWQGSASGWKLVDPIRSRHEVNIPPGVAGWAELRYRNLVPDPEQWQAALDNKPLPREPRATLITDFYSYNTSTSLSPYQSSDRVEIDEGAWMQPHWVGDLTLEASLQIDRVSAGGSIRLELIEGGVVHHCTINLESGVAVFTRGNSELGRARSPIRGLGRHRIQFANVDNRLSLMVDGQAVGGDGFEYDANETNPIPTDADLAPAAIAARDVSIVASDLVVKRDIYYTQSAGRIDYGPVWEPHYPRTPVELFDFLADPSQFGRLAKVGSHEYEIGTDRYFVLGDNSPRAKDSRAWGTGDSAWDPSGRRSWEVPRLLLTGKAFCVYWPRSVPIGSGLRISRDDYLMFRPSFERMRWIR